MVESIRENLARQLNTGWIGQGISPQRLAITLALGFAIGCLPVVGIPTLLCAALALALRLNLPAMQAANYVAMPLQFALIVPFVKLGGWIFSGRSNSAVVSSLWGHPSVLDLAQQSGALVGHTLTAWLVIALPAVLLLTVPLTLVLRRIPALAAAEAGD